MPCGRRTAHGSSSASRRSRRSTTRATSSTSTPTSSPPDDRGRRPGLRRNAYRHAVAQITDSGRSIATRESGMTITAQTGIDDLRARVAGPVLLAGDDGYEEARSRYNADIDQRPAVIARCTGPQDVAAALAHARNLDLEVIV